MIIHKCDRCGKEKPKEEIQPCDLLRREGWQGRLEVHCRGTILRELRWDCPFARFDICWECLNEIFDFIMPVKDTSDWIRERYPVPDDVEDDILRERDDEDHG